MKRNRKRLGEISELFKKKKNKNLIFKIDKNDIFKQKFLIPNNLIMINIKL